MRPDVRCPGWMAAWLIVLSVVSSASAQRDARVPDPDPELERQSFQVADGFEVNLFAADPMIAKPIQMNFDPQGRLWIASSEVYPQIKPGQVADDKVLILEDNDGDGRADKTTVFADGLLIPTGIEPGDGGAYVANSTELLHMKDNDGDGKADTRRVVLSGFGTEDTHHILHTLRWGFDGMLYMNQSIYIHSHIETPYGVRRLGGGGIWQFRPETMRLEVFMRGLVNPWGHHYDRWGQNFATDGAGGEGINYVLPGAYYVTAPDAVRVLKGLNPGSPKYCGLEVVSGRHMPEDWRGNLLTNDFRANRVCRFVLSDDGAGFAAREMPELIKTTHPAFRPIDIKMGPDGAIYIADWYNPIIQHGEVDFRDPRRDHTHGRIWRVTAKGRPLVERPKLVGATTEALLDHLKDPEQWTRHQAKRVLKERGAEAVVPALASWVRRLDPDATAYEHQALEALWTYQSLDVLEPELLGRLLDANDGRVRAAATRVVQHWADRLSDPLALLARCVEDEHPRVRLEAVRVLAHIDDPRAVEIALRALDRPVDPFLDYALWLTARELGPVWLPALQAGQLDFGGQIDHMIFALNALGSPEVVQPLLASLRAGKVPEDQQERVLSVIAALGKPEDLGVVLDAVLDSEDLPPAGRARLLETLAEATRRHKTRPAGDLGRLAALLDADEPSLRASAARAVGAWSLQGQRSKLIAMAEDGDAPPNVRQAAVEGLARLGGPESRKALVRLTEGERPASLRRLAVEALVRLDPKTAAARAVAVLTDTPGGEDPSGIFARLVERQGGPAALVEALDGKTLPADVAKLGLRVASASGRPMPELVEALRQAGGLDTTPAPLSDAEKAQLLADVTRLGDPARGEAVFRRASSQCLNCHAIAGAGGQVGPGLESLGASAQLDYLLDSLLEPGKAVKENYHAQVVATADGRIITGIKVRQTDDALVLRDAEDKEVTIPLADIEDAKTGGSLMPTGLIDNLTRQELLDLLRFLDELGTVGPYAVGKAAVARRWEVLEPLPGQEGELRRFGYTSAIRNDPRFRWASAYSTVAGYLPHEDIPEVPTLNDQETVKRLARCQVEVTTPGPVRIVTNARADNFDLWLDGAQIEASPERTLDLSPGIHTLTFILQKGAIPDGLRCELTEVPNSPARARFVLGK